MKLAKSGIRLIMKKQGYNNAERELDRITELEKIKDFLSQVILTQKIKNTPNTG